MRIIVHKYGGSSLSTPEKVKRVARKVVAQKRAGWHVAVVVSAMGDTTNRFLGLARAVSEAPSTRELDILLTAGEQISMSLLSMAIAAEGEEAVSLTGAQAGIVTTEAHNKAQIIEVRPHRVQAELSQGKIPVVAGFQGLSYAGEVTTLGRGGSDTSAVALASALKAERCEIYSDVDGIYSSDPRLVPNARRIGEIGYEAMQEMARQGARILNADAVEFARRSGTEIRALSTFEEGPGTIVHDLPGQVSGDVVGVAGRGDLFRLRLKNPSRGQQLETILAEADVLREHQNEYLVSAENVPDLTSLRERLIGEFDSDLACCLGLGSVSLIGAELGGHQELLKRSVKALARAGVQAVDTYSGHHSLTCLLPAQEVATANQLLHNEFIEIAVTL